ncbi:hypothetical protein [Roseivirga pacifica]
MARKKKWTGWFLALGLVLLGAYQSDKIREYTDKVINKTNG